MFVFVLVVLTYYPFTVWRTGRDVTPFIYDIRYLYILSLLPDQSGQRLSNFKIDFKETDLVALISFSISFYVCHRFLSFIFIIFFLLTLHLIYSSDS